MKNLDDILSDALSPKDEPDEKLNAKIMGYEKEKKMGMIKSFRRKSFPAAVAAAALIMVSSVTAFAAWRYLSAREVAVETADVKLADAFENHNWLDSYETQSFGEYDITLLGVVAGNEISDHLSKDDMGNVDGDKTYVAVAVSHSDGSPMPDQRSDDFDPTQFFVSPYMKGLNPINYNAYTLGGGFTCFVSDGIQYRILETDNVECFADRGIYIGVSEGMAYNKKAYHYDEDSGELSRNADFDGVNALFILPVDPSKADHDKADRIIRSMAEYEQAPKTVEILSEANRWANGITPDNISEKGKPVERTGKTVSFEEFIKNEFGDTPVPEGLDLEEIAMREYFPNGTGMSERMAKYAVTMEDVWVETYTLNDDGTVTYLRYVPE